MGSAKETVPVIDLSNLFDSQEPNFSSSSVQKIVEEIRNACKTWGFFCVVGHGVSPDIVQDLRQAAKTFFYKPKEFKKSVQRKPNNFRGYTDNELTKQTLDWKEAFDFGAEYPDGSNTGIDLDAGRNQWPDLPNFRENLLKYFSAMHSLSSKIIDLIFLGLDVDPKSMRHHFNAKTDASFCRLNYYPVYTGENGDKTFGNGPHSDSGFLTVLLQDDEVSSLQVQRRDTGLFYDVAPIPGSFVINIGDMMQIWSNALFNAPVHRVLSNPGKERFSVPFFFNPSYDTDVEPLKNCVSEKRPAKYRKVNWGHFRRTRIIGNYGDYGEEIQIYQFEIKD